MTRPVDHQVVQGDDADQPLPSSTTGSALIWWWESRCHASRWRAPVASSRRIPRHHILAPYRPHSLAQGVKLGLLQQLLQILAADVQQFPVFCRAKSMSWVASRALGWGSAVWWRWAPPCRHGDNDAPERGCRASPDSSSNRELSSTGSST